jgi:hypothetical protein
MKLTAEARENLAAAIKDRVAEVPESIGEIAALANVDPSQASRICRGQFKTASHNVVRICSVIGVLTEGVAVPSAVPGPSRDQRRIEATVVALWDRSPDDADRLVRFLRNLQALRGPNPDVEA